MPSEEPAGSVICSQAVQREAGAALSVPKRLAMSVPKRLARSGTRRLAYSSRRLRDPRTALSAPKRANGRPGATLSVPKRANGRPGAALSALKQLAMSVPKRLARSGTRRLAYRSCRLRDPRTASPVPKRDGGEPYLCTSGGPAPAGRAFLGPPMSVFRRYPRITCCSQLVHGVIHRCGKLCGLHRQHPCK